MLLVLFYHAGATAYVPRGYLGVDIFFVISGFLVTGMIVRAADAGNFSYLEFYSRRARRILPAAYCTFACTLLAAPSFLTQPELLKFIQQLIGAVTFTANIVLSYQSGYFESAAELKPLLHTWSLSVEEQFYCVLPLVLVTIGAAKRIRVVTAIGVVSLAVYLIWLTRQPFEAFYLLPARAWELLVGSLVALLVGRRERLNLPASVLMMGVVLLVSVPVIPTSVFLRGADNVLITGATALLIAGHHRGLEEPRLARRFAIIGDWSYSLYLIHWPLFAFAVSGFAGREMPATVRAGILAAAFPLAYLQYRYVEQTTRSMALPAIRPMMLGASALLLAAAVWFRESHAKATDYVWRRRINYGLHRKCEFDDARYALRSGCATSPNPAFALWGDSYAMALADGLRELPLIQMTKSACGAVLGVANVTRNTPYDRRFAQRCMDLNESVFEYIAAHPSITTVIMSGTFVYIDPNTRQLHDGKVDAMSVAEVADAYVRTISRLRAIGKKVVIVAFPPGAPFNRGECLERRAEGLILIGLPSCDVPDDHYRTGDAKRARLLSDVERLANVAVLWPHDVLCDGTVCHSELNGKFVYRDFNHLSHEGSIEFAKAFGLARRIVESAH